LFNLITEKFHSKADYKYTLLGELQLVVYFLFANWF